MKHTCDRTVPFHFRVHHSPPDSPLALAQAAQVVWASLWAPGIPCSMDLGWDLAYASGKHIQKMWKTLVFQENNLQMVHFPGLSLQEGTLLWRNCKNPLHVWAPPHSTTGLLQHVKRLSTASANKTERTWKKHNFPSSTFRQKYPHHSATTSSVGQQGSRPHKDLPRSVEPFYDAASPAQAYVKLCETICHFPSALYHTWSDLEGFFPWRCVFWHSKSSILPLWWWECFDTCLPCSLLMGESSADIPLGGIPLGGFFWFRAILWMRPSFGLDICWNVLRCSPISAVLSTQNEGIRSLFNWLFVLL